MDIAHLFIYLFLAVKDIAAGDSLPLPSALGNFLFGGGGGFSALRESLGSLQTSSLHCPRNTGGGEFGELKTLSPSGLQGPGAGGGAGHVVQSALALGCRFRVVGSDPLAGSVQRPWEGGFWDLGTLLLSWRTSEPAIPSTCSPLPPFN